MPFGDVVDDEKHRADSNNKLGAGCLKCFIVYQNHQMFFWLECCENMEGKRRGGILESVVLWLH